MNDNDFNTNYEVSRRLGSVTEEFGENLLSLAENTCKTRLRGIPKWKEDIVVSDGVMKCLELFNDVNYTLRNPIDFFHTAVDNLTLNYVITVYEAGTQDTFGCSLIINKNNGRKGGKTLVAKQIIKEDGYID